MNLRFWRRTPPPATPDDFVRLQLAEGDVTDILPATLVPLRSIEADRAAVTARIEAIAAAGGIDRATGGHILDEEINAWYDGQLRQLRLVYGEREAASDGLIGRAEGHHQEALHRLGEAAAAYRRHAAEAAQARREMIGDPVPATLAHDALLAQAEQRIATHDAGCPTAHPHPWEAPWRERAIASDDLGGLDR